MTILPYTELAKIIKARFPLVHERSFHLVDDEYCLMHDDAVAAYYRRCAAQARLRFGEWKANTRDCDKRTSFCRFIAEQDNMDNDRLAGIAFGTLGYTSEKRGGRHAVNLVVTGRRENGELVHRVRVFDSLEPAGREEIFLTETERNSAHRIVI